MDFATVLVLVIIATTQATQYNCNNSNVYMLGAEASGMDDLQQLQYCLVDNCTIMRIDTEQQMDIAYTTKSYHVVTPTDGQTSMLILKNEPELICLPPDPIHVPLLGGYIIICYILTGLASGFTVAVLLFFKELRNTLGKLMIGYNIGHCFQNITLVVLVITTYAIAVNLIVFCYTFTFLFLQSIMIREESTTCVIAYLAYIMHSGCKSLEVKKEDRKRLFKYSMAYIFGMSLLFTIFIISYDVAGGYRHVILPTGHCGFIPESTYDTIKIIYASNIFNTFLQVLFFVAYFIYYFKIQNSLKLVHSMTSSNRSKDLVYLKLSIAMAVTIGISKLFYILDGFIDHPVWLIIGGLFSLVQQILLMSLIMCSKKMLRLCKERFSTTKVSP